MEGLTVAVVGGPPVVRLGLALQLRLRGVGVADRITTLRTVDPRAHLDGVVLIGDPHADTEAVTTLLAHGLNVVALHDGDPRRPSTGTVGPVLVHPQTPATVARRLLSVPATPGARGRGRLVLVPLAALSGVDVLIDRLAGGAAPRAVPTALTPTERAVHALLGQGYSNAGIARRLSLSPKTVEGCVTALFGKLGLTRDDPARNRRVAAALTWVAGAP